MHKFFAKPVFLGKKVLFLPQCHSTNDVLAKLVKSENIPEGMVVYSDHQLKGRGQRGNTWIDEPGKNVLFSLLLKPKKLPIKLQFYLNLILSLSVADLVKKRLKDQEIKVKWPNDVMVNEKKISGILIENSLRGSSIEWSICGIGVNTNQIENLPNTATSIRKELGVQTDRNKFMDDLLLCIEFWYQRLMKADYQNILKYYHQLLHWKDETHIFKSNGSSFEGMIKGVDHTGRLRIESSGKELLFGVKEVQFID